MIMRIFSIFRVLALTAAASAPLAQAAMAQAASTAPQEQQAMSPNVNGSAGTVSYGSPYDNDPSVFGN